MGYVGNLLVSNENVKMKIPNRFRKNKEIMTETSTNKWKPSRLKDPSMDKIEPTVITELRGLLNKITKESFEKLTTIISELEIKTEENMQKFAELIFNKAVLETAFCDLYASLIKKLANNNKTFLNEFLKQCQNEFELQQVNDTDKLVVESRRIDGTIKLLTSLYYAKVIPAKLLRLHCLDRLLNDAVGKPTGYATESVCKLILLLGKNNSTGNSIQECKITGEDATTYISTLESLKDIVKQHSGMRIVFLIEDAVNILMPLTNCNVVLPIKTVTLIQPKKHVSTRRPPMVNRGNGRHKTVIKQVVKQPKVDESMKSTWENSTTS